MIQLSLEYGAITIDLQAGGHTVLDGYIPGSSSGQSVETISERFDVMLIGTETEIETKIRALGRAFEHARAHQTDNQGLYLNFAMSEGLTPWRARIIDGQVLYTSSLGRRWKAGRPIVSMVFERLPYWEGPVTAIPLTNSNGSAVTDGLNVFNCNDATGTAPNKRENYVDIAADAIAGDLPAPVSLELTNSYNHVWPIYRIIVGANMRSWAGGVAGPQWFEAEAGAYGGSETADTACSGGKYMAVPVSSNGDTVIGNWTLSGAQQLCAAGNHFHVLMAHRGAPNSDCRYRTGVFIGGHYEYQEYKFVDGTLRIQYLGLAAIPPAGIDPARQYGDGALKLYAKRMTEDLETINYDWLALVPQDGFRLLSRITTGGGEGVEYGQKLVDDPVSDLSPYVADATGKYLHPWKAEGTLRVMPGYPCRLTFYQDSDADVFAARLMSVKASYRPRRSSL